MNLSPGISHEVPFVVTLKEPTKGWEKLVNQRLVLPNEAIIDRTYGPSQETYGRYFILENWKY